MTFYDNTPELESKIGWSLVPEYCFGDIVNALYVYHDVHNGIFLFTNTKSFCYAYVYGLGFIDENSRGVIDKVEAYENTYRAGKSNQSFNVTSVRS